MSTMHKRKRGFSIIELVIVIAIIAILAAVLIPTFANVVDRAKLSSDSVAVDEMNTALSAEEILDGKPENMYEVRVILDEAGFNTKKNLTPVSKGYSFVWNSVDNRIMLVNAEGIVVHPADYKDVTLDKLAHIDISYPAAQVEEKGAQTVPLATGSSLALDCSFIYTGESETEAAKSDYANWRTDFVISFNQEVTMSSEDDFKLAGQYNTHNANWEPVPPAYLTQINDLNSFCYGNLTEKANSGTNPGKVAYYDFSRFVEADEQGNKYFSIKQGDEIELMPFVAGRLTDVFNYQFICSSVQKFQCGAYANPTWLEKFTTPLTMTVELRLYKPYYDADGQVAGYYDGRKVEDLSITAEQREPVTMEKDYITVHVYNYTFA